MLGGARCSSMVEHIVGTVLRVIEVFSHARGSKM